MNKLQLFTKQKHRNEPPNFFVCHIIPHRYNVMLIYVPQPQLTTFAREKTSTQQNLN